ncbi:MAG TPA: hypothetical protein VGC66_06670 [Pyrinomonadaceae bacterium]
MLRTLFWLALALSSAAFLRAALGRESPVPGAIRQSPDVRLQVQTESGRTRFQMGEIIPLKLAFTSSAVKKYQINMATYDRSGRMNYEKFMVEPESGISDPLHSYFAYGGFIGGGISSSQFLSQEPTVISLDLNEWVRFDRPGKYSLRIVSSRVGELPGDKSYADTSRELVSNELQLTIVPANKSWQEATLKKAVTTLDAPKAANDNTGAAETPPRQTALKTLRYLGTAEATKEMAGRFRGEDSQADYMCMFGLVGSPYRDLALSEMQRLLSAPDHPVSSTFMYALAVLMRSPDLSTEKLSEEEKKNREMIQSELLNAISQKRGLALALTLTTILETGGFEGGKPKPVSAQLASQIAAVFDQLPLEKQAEIFESRWEMIKGPLFLPILRKYALRYRDFPIPNEVNAYNSLRMSGAALLHWYELEPDEARAVIIQEIIRPKPRFSASILGILPDKTLPEVEQALAENFVKQDSYAADNLASLLERYATDSVLPQILPVVDKNVGKWACAIQTPILAYMLRVNPDIARPRIEAAMAARGEEYSACNHSLLVELGALQQDPMLEEIAVGSLDDNDPQVAGNAAAFLGKYGSPAAEEMLWKRLSLWNEKWRGREREFRYVPGENNPKLWDAGLGSNLILALGAGKSWLTDESKLRRLRQLAVGKNMLDQVDSMISAWQAKPYLITYFPMIKEQRFHVLQYELDSLKNLEEKLAQFPAGSSFIWSGSLATPAEDERMFQELSNFATSHGMKLNRLADQR